MIPVAGTPASIPYLPRTLRQPQGAGEQSERASTTPPLHGAKPSLAHAREMADDATALAASFAQRRAGRGDAGQRGTVEEWSGRMLDEHSRDHLAQLKALLLSQRPDAGTLQQALNRMFSDPSDAFAALRALLADEELAETRTELENALRQLLGSDPVGTRAGANVANVATATAARHRNKKRLGAKALRTAYRSLLGSKDALQLYMAWIDVFGEDERTHVIDFVSDALVADMCCSDPSCSSPMFGRMLRSARLLACLRSLERRFCTDPLFRELLGADALATALRPMLQALCSELDTLDWCERQLAALDEARAECNDDRQRLCLALRRFFKSISADLLPLEVRLTVIDWLDQRSQRLRLDAGHCHHLLDARA